MDTTSRRKQLVKSCEHALDQLDKVINQEIEIDLLEPEKAKIATQGKIEAIEGYDKILGIISSQLITIENEQNAKEGKGQDGKFAGAESKAK